MSRCFVYCAGDFYGEYEKPQPEDTVIAADAGYLLCKRLGVKPTLVIGDFDSMPKPQLEELRCAPVEKDDTDTMLALREGLRRGCTEFYLYGASGGERLDHTLANLQALAFLRRNGAKGYLYDRNFVYTVIENETLTVKKTVEWGLLSLFALSSRVRSLTLEGVQYPLREHTLENTFPLCVSNHFAADTAKITAEGGLLLVGWELAGSSLTENRFSAHTNRKPADAEGGKNDDHGGLSGKTAHAGDP